MVVSITWYAYLILIIISRCGLLGGIRWTGWFCRTIFGLCILYLPVGWNFSHLHNSWSHTFPTQTSLFFDSFCTILLHSLILWFIVSPLSSHSLPLLFYWFLSIIACTWLVYMRLFLPTIDNDSVSVFTYLSWNYIQVTSCTLFLVCLLKWNMIF